MVIDFTGGNENKLDEMNLIFECFMKLVLTLSRTSGQVLRNGDKLEMDGHKVCSWTTCR